MSKTTRQQLNRPVRVDEENRFSLAGRLLGYAGVLEEEGEMHDAGILSRIAQVVATEGPDFARGWVEGAHYFAGVRIHDVWMTAREILEKDRQWGAASSDTIARCDVCGETSDHHHPEEGVTGIDAVSRPHLNPRHF